MNNEVAFAKSGVTSWGYSWAWNFGGPVKLKDTQGFVVLTTEFHTLESEYNFEDSRKHPYCVMSDEQDREWDDICWECYRADFTVYGMAQKGFRSCVGQLIYDYSISHPAKDGLRTWMPDSDFRDMLSACLNAIRAKWGWRGENKDWLFNPDGPINDAVHDWLMDELESEGYRLD